jgi:cysteine desulfurase
MRSIYLDHAATTPVHPEVVEAMLPFFGMAFGNPSSLHAFGQEARKAVERARGEIAAFIGAAPEEIVFTGGGTESNNFSLYGVSSALRSRGGHIVTSAIEHHAILEPCRHLEESGIGVTRLPVDGTGLVDPDLVRGAITDRTILVSIMHANNEIGTIQPIAEIGRICREKGVLLHTDAVQTLGHIPVNVDDLGIDLLSASAHKLYGPKGAGILYIRKGTRISPFLRGGEQERKRRASTHNVPGIAGFGKAVEIARKEAAWEGRGLSALRDRLIRGILDNIPDTLLNGHPRQRLPNNVNVSIAGVEGEAMLLRLDMEGIACSTGSACSSTSLEPSHVLAAIGLPRETAHGSLRFTLGRGTTEDEIDYVLQVLSETVRSLRALSPIYERK